MKVTVGEQVWTLTRESITNRELIAIEKATSMTSAEWAGALERGSMLAATGLVWLVRRREEADLAFEDVEFSALTSLSVDLADEGDDEGKGHEPQQPPAEASQPS